MNINELREFAQRDWGMISKLDRKYWANEYKTNGPASCRQASDNLRQHMISINPQWPAASDREADLQHHIRIKQLLDQATNGLKSF